MPHIHLLLVFLADFKRGGFESVRMNSLALLWIFNIREDIRRQKTSDAYIHWFNERWGESPRGGCLSPNGSING